MGEGRVRVEKCCSCFCPDPMHTRTTCIDTHYFDFEYLSLTRGVRGIDAQLLPLSVSSVA
jgi:hypothetical protein